GGTAVCSLEGQRRWQPATSTGWPHGPRVGLRRRSPLGASPGPALEAPRAVVPRVLPRRTSREQRWRQSVWPNDDRAPPCTVAPHTASQRSCMRMCCLVMSRVVSSCILGHGLSSLSARIGTSHLYAGFPHRHQDLAARTLTPQWARGVLERGAGTLTRPFLDADGYLIGLTWLCLSALSQGLVFHDRSLP